MKRMAACSSFLSKLSVVGILALPLLLTHCRATNMPTPFPAAPDITPKHPTMTVVKTSHINRISMSGNVRLILSTQPNHQNLIFRIPSDHPSQPYVSTKGHTLTIKNDSDTKHPLVMHLVIGSRLHLLTVDGTASVVSTNLHTKNLTVVDSSSGLVDLRGMLDLRTLYASGGSRFSALWVNSPKLIIHGDDQAHIHLAGTTKALFARTTGSTRLDAQALRANTITINSTDQSQAKLLPIFSFQGFAHDQSILYLYHKPPHMNRHTWDMGNIFMASYRP